jgi:hypothetical protein
MNLLKTDEKKLGKLNLKQQTLTTQKTKMAAANIGLQQVGLKC